ncbi:hypothetical protein NQ314_012866, partial [Rhamnusium bicolor]
GFEPSHRYYESNLPNYRPTAQNTTKPDRKDTKQESRFGIIPITSYGSSGNGMQYGNGNGNGNGNGGIGYMLSPMKIDLGGVALGALIGLGAILIVPKLAHVLSGGIGGYRSLENEMSSVTEILSRIDNSLEQNNIDSSSCIQRIICSYVNDAQTNIKNGEASSMDEFVFGLTNNTLFSYILDGTAVKQAVEMAKTGDMENCSSLHSKCPITKENVMKIISSLLPA